MESARLEAPQHISSVRASRKVPAVAGLAVALVVAIAALRILTDWHVLAVLIAVAAVGVGFLWLRQHFISEGYAEAQPSIEAAQTKAASIARQLRDAEACFAKINHGYVWDMTQKKCLSISGAIGGG